MKELEEIVIKNFGATRWMLLGEIAKADMLLLAKELYNKGVTDSAETADLDIDTSGPGCYYSVDKNSILKNLIQ